MEKRMENKDSRTSFIAIPSFSPPPSHRLFRRYRVGCVVRQIRDLIDWSRMEYQASLRYFSKRGDIRTFTYLSREFSHIRVLSMCSVFYEVCDYILQNEDVWNSLDVRTRRVLSSAYDFALKSGFI